MEKCAKAYNDYEFLVVTHAVNDFCVVDMSNFYLDIIKDRLYCEEKDGAKRRSAQTALFLILDTMTKLMAPSCASPAMRSGSLCPTAAATMVGTWCSTT